MSGKWPQSLAAKLSFAAGREARFARRLAGLGPRSDVVFHFGCAPLVLVVPEVPEVPPLVPADAEVLHVEAVLGKHLADFTPGHTGHAVAIDDNVSVLRERPEGGHDAFNVAVG